MLKQEAGAKYLIHFALVARVEETGMKRDLVRYGLLIALAWSCSAGAAEAVRVDVAMVDYRFSPDRLAFEHGVHYRLHLENRGKETHEFTAPTFFSTAKLDNPEVLNREHSEVVVQPGESKDVFFTPGAPGAYDLRCGDHDWDGMVGGITVR
jgi:plastocyanin